MTMDNNAAAQVVVAFVTAEHAGLPGACDTIISDLDEAEAKKVLAFALGMLHGSAEANCRLHHITLAVWLEQIGRLAADGRIQ